MRLAKEYKHMKKEIRTCIYALIGLCIPVPSSTYDIISLYLKPYPLTQDKASSQTVANNLSRPTNLARYQSRIINEKIMPSGIFGIYAGNIDISNLNGHLVFPYKHSKPMVYLVITNQILPTVMFFNTLKNWKLRPGEPAQMFKVERKQDDVTQQLYWDVEKIDLPQDGIIPLEAVILLAKPKHIYVPEGITPTEQSPHLLLPDVYVRKGINKTENALYILNLKHFFGNIEAIHRIDKKRYLQYNFR